MARMETLTQSSILLGDKKSLMFKLQERSLDELVNLRSQLKLNTSAPLDRKLVESINEEDPKKGKSAESIKKNNVGNTDQIDNAVQLWMNGEATEKKVVERSSAAGGVRRKGSEAIAVDRKFQWKGRTKLTDNVQAVDARKRGATVDVRMAGDAGKNPQMNKLKNNEKNDTKDSSGSKKENKESYVVTCYEDIPKKFRKDVEKADINLETVGDNLFSLLNILHFCEHNVVFIYKKGDIERKTRSQKKSVKYDVEKKEEELLTKENPKELYKLGDQLGKGGFGTVYEAKYRKKPKGMKGDGKIAIKVMPHANSHQRKYNLKEIEYLLKYKHTNIVDLQGAYLCDNDVWIVMELLKGGTLTEARNSHRFTEPQIGYIANRLLKGIAFIHSNGLIHRDIKSQNVMMAVDGTIKLIDFGLCHDTKIYGNVVEMVGSPYWMCPEMLKGEEHSFGADIWSYAICILELANNEAPNTSNKLKAMYTVATVGLPEPLNKPEKWSKNFKWFLRVCLKMDPKERATSEDLLTHPFFEDMATRSVMTDIFSSIFITKALNTFL